MSEVSYVIDRALHNIPQALFIGLENELVGLNVNFWLKTNGVHPLCSYSASYYRITMLFPLENIF